ncbi:RRP5 [Candida theae]|uniref:rRNA biogenesis protein RRP5 n=1 Tax=Candida theae TaxID=1198502 RepID=A0AAD5BHA1_9ASCO|nr:RRP5 [Candida theae]KAI5963375.1 RRP5 [Candida theae]
MSDATDSKISSNEYAFPRGGATGLTPLEVKEISNEATKDVLFEVASANKRTSKATDSNTPRKKQRTSKKQGPKSKQSKEEDETEDEKKVPIEYLSFKNLAPGSFAFGQIQAIYKLDIVLALENNLVGYVPITSISSHITELINKYEEESEEEEEEEEEEEQDEDDGEEEGGALISSKPTREFPDLKAIFNIGSWLKAKVVGTEIGNKKRIEMSIEPELVNANLEKEDLVPGNILSCSVKSVEDHGLILECGIDGLSAFVSNKELKNAGLDPNDFNQGSVLTTVIISKPSGRTITVKPAVASTSKKLTSITTISSVDAIQVGATVDALVSEVTESGITARVFGLVDGTINLSDLQVFSVEELKHKFAIGSNVKARIMAILQKGGVRKLVLSLISHTLKMEGGDAKGEALEAFPVGHIFDIAEVLGSDREYIYVKLGLSIFGQVHNSNIDETKTLIDYSVSSKHKARVIAYNMVDNLYVLTFKPSTIEAPYLSVRDIPIGTILPGCVITEVLPGSGGIQVKFLDDFQGFIPPNHMSDIKLVYPERKFRVGSKVKGRLLAQKGKTPLITVRKSLVNLDGEDILSNFDNAKIGLRTNATVEKFVHGGVIVSFFGTLRAFLPKNEISETFVDDASKYLKLGQVVNVKILDINNDERRLVVTLKQSSQLSTSQKSEISSLIPGISIVEAVVVEKKNDSVLIELVGSNLRGVVHDGQLSDGNYEQNRALFKKLEVSSQVEVLILEKDLKARTVIATAKKSLIEASKKKQLPADFDDVQANKIIKGYVKSVTNLGLFVTFTGRLTGLILAKYVSKNAHEDLSKRFYKYQSLTCRVLSVDAENRRFLLTIADTKDTIGDSLTNPVDSTKKTIEDYAPGSTTRAIIKSVKGTQLNVKLADNLNGRVDVTQCFKSIKDIKNSSQPLSSGFNKGDVLDVKVIGVHDAKNHTFLPITHNKVNKQTVIELSLQDAQVHKKHLSELKLADVKKGDELVAFVNNIDRGFVWVSITPSIKGRVSFMDLSDDGSIFHNFENRYPIGAAIQVKVKEVDNEHHTLALVSRKRFIHKFDDVEKGKTYPARVIKVKDSYVLVDLGDKVIASSFITDALNDYSDKLEHAFHVNEYVGAKVLDIDQDEQKISVSLRDEAHTTDRTINSFEDLSRGNIVKGFVKNVNTNGVYVSLGRSVFALVRVSDLSDSYLKDWKKFFKPNQPVTGKIVSCKEEGRILMTLKESEVNGELKTMKRFEDLSVGDIFEGHVTKTTDFGVFVKLDGTVNVSGLCHHSEISENDVKNVMALFGEGDRVKVKILKIDPAKKQLSLGMKASYFDDKLEKGDVEMENAEEIDDDEDDDEQEEEEDSGESENDDVIVDAEDDNDDDDDENDEEEDEEDEEDESTNSQTNALSTNGFDWTASILDQTEDQDSSSEDEDFMSSSGKKKARKQQQKQKKVEDKTIDLNTRAPQSVSDFERLLIGNPNSSILWMNYMSFNLQLSEVDKARQIGERALETINYREEQEKLNIWIALLNLENTFGSDESLNAVFKKACQYMDSFTIHQKLASILIMSEKYDEARELFKSMGKKFGQNVTTWISYGSFLLDHQGSSTEARQVLAKALQVLPKRDHIEVVRKFAQLEYAKGDVEQARSLFEGLIADAPKRIDLWNVYIDQEIKHGNHDGEREEGVDDNQQHIESLFERVIENKKVSRKQAKFFFNKWLQYEEGKGDEKMVGKVKAKAIEYVRENEQ